VSRRRPRLLDLYCGAGGAAAGYQRAGFRVTGVDIEPQPHYPGAFIHDDVLDLSAAFLARFDVIHASPPCRAYTALRSAPGAVSHPMLIQPTRALLRALGKPYVIENVEGAASWMDDPIRLCGTMFELGAGGYELRRHRLFESNLLIVPPHRCWHHKPVLGIYGGHVRHRAASTGGRRTRDFDGADKPGLAAKAMGIDWMSMAELSDAIPPAYTHHIGLQLLGAA
jgi:DNA (cytosine-5)-methyltransferase 1